MGSRRMRCSLPCHADVTSRIKSWTVTEAMSGDIPFPQRYLDGRLLGVKRIEAHRDQNHVAAGGQWLAVKDDLVVVGGVEAQA